MDLLMILQTAWRSITINKLRSALTALGIIIGVASVIIMVALSQGATAAITERIASMGSNLLIVMPGGTRGPVRGGSSSQLTLEDARALSALPFVQNVAPEANTEVTASFSNTTWQASLSGTTPQLQEIKNWKIEQGTFFSENDVLRMSMVAVLGKTAASNLFPAGVTPLGQTIRINGISFTVIGVLASQGAGGMGMDQDNTIYVPITTAQQKLIGNQRVRLINVQASSAEALPAVQQGITFILRQRHRLAANAEDDFRIMDMAQVLSTVEETSRTMTLLLGGIAAVSLLVGGIGIMNIMLVSVTERTREIGIRMAVGATTRDILTQFLVEAILLSVSGGVIGIILGWGLAHLFSLFSGWPTVVSPQVAILALAFSMAVGLFFGYYPAKQAASANPIEALRYE